MQPEATIRLRGIKLKDSSSAHHVLPRSLQSRGECSSSALGGPHRALQPHARPCSSRRMSAGLTAAGAPPLTRPSPTLEDVHLALLEDDTRRGVGTAYVYASDIPRIVSQGARARCCRRRLRALSRPSHGGESDALLGEPNGERVASLSRFPCAPSRTWSRSETACFGLHRRKLQAPRGQVPRV